MATSVDAHGRVIVEEPVLLAWYRARLRAWPIHQQRMRVAARAEGDAVERRGG